MQKKLQKEIDDFRLLLQSIPTLAVTLFILAVFSMNLLANKSILLPFDWLALDCGIVVSWFAFLVMDIITTHFGPKAATQISVFAAGINLILCLLFFLCSKIPGVWGEACVEGSEAVIGAALDHTFGGTWYVLVGSTLAFLVSAVVNNFTNWGIGRLFAKRSDRFAAYAFRTYLSTSLGQFVDNLTFALVVSHVFFGWSLLQCVTCALTGMVAELLAEVLFSGIGYRICQRWKRERLGEEYFRQLEKEKQA